MDNSVLKKIFNREICPAQQAIPKDPEYKILSKEISEHRDYFTDILSKEDQKRLEELQDLMMQRFTIESYDIFAEGYRLGAQLMLAAFNEDIRETEE